MPTQMVHTATSQRLSIISLVLTILFGILYIAGECRPKKSEERVERHALELVEVGVMLSSLDPLSSLCLLCTASLQATMPVACALILHILVHI